MAEIIVTKIGMVTAYAYAVSKGYPGTEEQFAEDLKNVGINIEAIQSAIDTFNQQTVPTATQAIIDEALERIRAITAEGTAQVQAVNDTGSANMAEINSRGQTILDGIVLEGERQTDAVTAEGTAQVAAVNTAGSDQVSAITAEGTAQLTAITTEGETQVSAVTTEGETQLAAITAEGASQVQAIEDKGTETRASIPSDYSKMGYLQELLHDEVADTVAEYTFENGQVSRITHKRAGVAVRTDVFAYGTDTITETRTLSGGQKLVIESNLSTLETSITYTA